MGSLKNRGGKEDLNRKNLRRGGVHFERYGKEGESTPIRVVALGRRGFDPISRKLNADMSKGGQEGLGMVRDNGKKGFITRGEGQGGENYGKEHKEASLSNGRNTIRN